MSAKNRMPNRLWRVLSMVMSAVMVVGITMPISTTPAMAIDIPQLVYPENYAETTYLTDPPLGVPSFSWTRVSGAINYRLQVDNEIGFNSPVTLDVTTPNSSFTPAATNHLFADGEWYWRVRVETPAPVGEWSEIRVFTKIWSAPYFNNPVPINPEENAVLAFFDAPDFSWTSVVGAARYRFQIATSVDGFNSPILSSDTITTTIQPNNRLDNGEYWWRVLPMDAADHLGAASDPRPFTLAYGTNNAVGFELVPELLAPLDETFPTFTPSFQWKAIIGAEHYRLEYTSDETCDFSIGTSVETRQTSYSPTDTFPNDVRYCWHVRAESGAAVGEWSETWHFEKRWYLQPVLLTPTNLYQTGLYPLYSWTPVPGAGRYSIEIADNPSFLNDACYETSVTANTTYAHQQRYCGYPLPTHYYWRVTPIDGGGKLGLTSAVGEFISDANSVAPIQVYPLYYYYVPGDDYYYYDYTINPHENRTAAYPVFIWHRVLNPPTQGGSHAPAYLIQVDTDPYFDEYDGEVIWDYRTENTSATPTLNDNFIPEIGTDYYWRVCPLTSLGGNCETNPGSGQPWWSQTWRARFDPIYNVDDPNPWVLPPTQGDTPELLRPAHGQESVEATPLLEWYPLWDGQDYASEYQVEVSREASFSTWEISETVTIPAYSPAHSIAQRLLDRLEYGTLYWRVRGQLGGVWTGWSDAWRFQIASQSEWRFIRPAGLLANRLVIGEDASEDALPVYDLTTLAASQSDGYWFLGFNTNITITNMSYMIYLDLDHLDGSGAPVPPEGPSGLVSTIAAHRPEFAIVVRNVNGAVSAENTLVYAWNEVVDTWGFGQRFIDIGGSVLNDLGYVELKIPNAAIGMSQVTSSASVVLFSVNKDTNIVEDSVPSDPLVPGNPELSRFSAVSERMNLIYPPSTVTGDPTTISSLLPFYWDWPTGGDPANPFVGDKLELHLDESYTNLVDDFSFTISPPIPYFSINDNTFLDDSVGDNIYYWRVQPKYRLNNQVANGAWASGWSFRRLGFTLSESEMYISTSFATPTFSWDMVEGANTYRLQVSTDPNFGTTVINQATPLTSFTPQVTLGQGIYYWRVQVNRFGNVTNDWSPVVQFSLTLPTPTGLTPLDNALVSYAPTFCWDHLVRTRDGIPVLTAWKYRVQVSQDPNFSAIYDTIDTIDRCWTPTKGYHDGAYYWHVAMIDGNGRLGPYSTPHAFFTKQYPITMLISPPNGGSVPRTPTFIWTPVDGAATYVFEASKFPTFSPTYDSIVTINTQFTPTKTYDRATAYYWRVAIRDRDGRQGPFTNATIIIDGPIVGLTATNDSPTEIGDLTTLTASIVSGTNVSYAWSYGDGDHGDGEVTSHIYPEVGNYTATVTATNTISSAMATTMVTIIDIPISGLQATNDSPMELGNMTTLTATVAAGTNVIYSWNFGDGTHGSGDVVTHTYAATGNFNAQVTATNGRNAANAVTVVHILDVPISGLTAGNDSPTHMGDATHFNASVEAGSNVSYAWSFGDGSFGSGATPSHIYPDLGLYTATVTATNPVSSMDASTQVTIIEEPIEGLTASNDSPTYLGGMTNFTASISQGSNVSYSWSFGDGTTGSGATPGHIYLELGEYTATVTATNSVSTQNAETLVIIVDVPITGLTATNDSPTELGSSTTLTATITGGTHVSYLWDFGDGATGNGPVVTHPYLEIGLYTATVTATNGTTAVATTLVTITDVPITGLSATNDSPTLVGETTTLTATITAGTGVTYAWGFGDGSSASGQVVTHMYLERGEYIAEVTAANSQGVVIATTTVVIVPYQPPLLHVYMPLTLNQ